MCAMKKNVDLQKPDLPKPSLKSLRNSSQLQAHVMFMLLYAPRSHVVSMSFLAVYAPR